MHLKWFRGKAVPDVMRQVREELGPEAIILHSRQRKPWGPLRLVQDDAVEILAAVDDAGAPGQAPLAPPSPAAAPDPSTTALRAEVAELRHMLIRLSGARLLPPELVPFHARLVAAGVSEPLALRIAEGLPRPRPGEVGATPDTIGRALEEQLASMIRVDAPDPVARPVRVAVVGPAGAGKTTSLAKLAARAKLAGSRPEIVDLDGTGLGAPAPLETFAAILDVPYLMVAGEDRPLARGGRRELTLIDTPGVTPADVPGLIRLGTALRCTQPDEVHLVLSATSKTADALATVRAFSVLGPTHLLFTRLDETTSVGSVLSVGVETGLPLSYFGSGREIPTDLVVATARDLARRTLSREGERS
jgi:flagellar biosynthesis protein FlhF